MGSFYRSQHEFVCVFKHGDAPHINNIELGRFGRNRTNLWTYPGANTFRQGRLEDLALHPTVKPVQLVADAILDATARGQIVLDCFAGASSTLMAAHQTGRRGYGIELDPLYVDISLERLAKITGLSAVHAEMRLTFEDLKAERFALSCALS